MFINETRAINNNSGIIGVIHKSTKCDSNSTLEKLNEAIRTRLSNIERAKTDRFKFNDKAQLVKRTLILQNSYLRKLKLNEILHYKKN